MDERDQMVNEIFMGSSHSVPTEVLANLRSYLGRILVTHAHVS